MPRLTERQLEERKTTLGSSDVATLICGGRGGVGDPWAVFNEKHGIGEREEESVEMWLGHEAEELMVRLYERETKRSVRPGNTHRHPSVTWATATVDGEIDEALPIGHTANGVPIYTGNSFKPLNRALECKLVGAHRMPDWDELIEDGIPHRVRIQVAWQCYVTGFEEIDVMGLLGGTRPRIWTVRRDRELEAMVCGVASAFYERCIASGHPPEIDGSELCRAYLETKHAHTVRGELMTEVPPHIDYLARQRILAHNTEKAGKEEKDRVDNLLRDALGNAPGYKVKGQYSIGWRVGKGLVRRYTFTAKGDPNE